MAFVSVKATPIHKLSCYRTHLENLAKNLAAASASLTNPILKIEKMLFKSILCTLALFLIFRNKSFLPPPPFYSSVILP